MKKRKTYAMIFSGLAIALNIVLATIVDLLNAPLLFLDTVGTIFSAVVFGPLFGALTGGLTNLVQAFITNPKTMFFAPVNIAIGIAVGLIARKREFTYPRALGTGIFLAILAPLVGTPIAVYVYGGITGDFNDILFTILRQSGEKMFTSAFIPRIASNLLDKIISCLMVAFLIDKTPKNYLYWRRNEEN